MRHEGSFFFYETLVPRRPRVDWRARPAAIHRRRCRSKECAAGEHRGTGPGSPGPDRIPLLLLPPGDQPEARLLYGPQTALLRKRERHVRLRRIGETHEASASARRSLAFCASTADATSVDMFTAKNKRATLQKIANCAVERVPSWSMDLRSPLAQDCRSVYRQPANGFPIHKNVLVDIRIHESTWETAPIERRREWTLLIAELLDRHPPDEGDGQLVVITPAPGTSTTLESVADGEISAEESRCRPTFSGHISESTATSAIGCGCSTRDHTGPARGARHGQEACSRQCGPGAHGPLFAPLCRSRNRSVSLLASGESALRYGTHDARRSRHLIQRPARHRGVSHVPALAEQLAHLFARAFHELVGQTILGLPAVD